MDFLDDLKRLGEDALEMLEADPIVRAVQDARRERKAQRSEERRLEDAIDRLRRAVDRL